MKRRRFLHLAAGAATLPAATRIAQAEGYPSRPVHWIVGYPAGGPTDIITRTMAQYLSERFSQSFVVENRPGANSNVGAEVVVRARPDGYTICELTLSNAINATLYDNLNFDLVRDFAPIAGIDRGTSVMEVTPSFPAHTVPEFIAYAKANPGKVNMASGGSGSPQHVYGELFKAMTGVPMLHVPYRGAAPALVDLMAGQVQVMFDTISSSIEYIKAGKLRALAVTSATRSDTLPDLPTLDEFVPGYEAVGWQGVGAPKNTPTEVVDLLNSEINAALGDPKMKARLAGLGNEPFVRSPLEFGKFMAAETEKWAKVIRFADIKPE